MKDLGCEFVGDGLDFQRRNARPQRVIFECRRRPEQCHQAVAGEFVDGSLIALHHAGSAVEELVHDLLEPLRVQCGRKFHRSDDVGEQHCHLLVLARNRPGGEWGAARIAEASLCAQVVTTRSTLIRGLGDRTNHPPVFLHRKFPT